MSKLNRLHSAPKKSKFLRHEGLKGLQPYIWAVCPGCTAAHDGYSGLGGAGRLQAAKRNLKTRTKADAQTKPNKGNDSIARGTAQLPSNQPAKRFVAQAPSKSGTGSLPTVRVRRQRVIGCNRCTSAGRQCVSAPGDHPDQGPRRGFAGPPGKIRMIRAGLASGLPEIPP
jgi:hypothetical protein